MLFPARSDGHFSSELWDMAKWVAIQESWRTLAWWRSQGASRTQLFISTAVIPMNGFRAIQKEHQHIISNIKYLNLSSKIFKIYSNLSKPGELWHSGLIPWISWDFFGIFGQPGADHWRRRRKHRSGAHRRSREGPLRWHQRGFSGTGFQLLLGLSVSSWGYPEKTHDGSGWCCY